MIFIAFLFFYFATSDPSASPEPCEMDFLSLDLIRYPDCNKTKVYTRLYCSINPDKCFNYNIIYVFNDTNLINLIPLNWHTSGFATVKDGISIYDVVEDFSDDEFEFESETEVIIPPRSLVHIQSSGPSSIKLTLSKFYVRHDDSNIFTFRESDIMPNYIFNTKCEKLLSANRNDFIDMHLYYCLRDILNRDQHQIQI